MTSGNSTPAAVRTILALLFLLASFTRPDLFWTGLLAFVFLLAMPRSLTIYIIGLLALELLSAWAADPACAPAERHVLRAFYWSALPGMLAHGVAGIVTGRRGTPLYWALGVAVVCGACHVGRKEGFGGGE